MFYGIICLGGHLEQEVVKVKCPRYKECKDFNRMNFTCMEYPQYCTESGLTERILKKDRKFKLKRTMVGQDG